jgi:PAS domain S-box-containing protein
LGATGEGWVPALHEGQISVTIVSDSARFSRTLRSAILWPVGIIFLTALLLLLFIFELLQVVKLSNRSYQVLAQTRTCENLAISTQNDVRGYLLTGDPAFTKSYQASVDKIDGAFSRLKTLVQDNPEQSIRAEAISQAKNTWLEHAKTMIAHRTQNVPVNSDWVLMGKTIIDDIRTKFDQFADVEETLRDQRQERVEHMKRGLAYGGGGLVILLALTVAYVVKQNMMALALNYRNALDTIELRHAALARSEADLEGQKEWLRVTLTSIGDGVIVADPTGRVMLMNHEAERLTGWTNLEALHQPLAAIFKIIDQTTRVAEEDRVTTVLRDKRVLGLAHNTLLISRTAEEWPIEDSAAPICDAQGNVLGVVLVFHDATETRDAQASLRAYSADLEKKVADRTTTLQQAVSELEAFSYTVSHDLRSPLRAMQGFSEAVLEDYGDKLDEQGRTYLERIRNAGERLDKLIQDLLSYTRISREDSPLQAIDLNPLIASIIERDPLLNAPDTLVHVEGKLPRVMGREAALIQVLSNLLGNAAKFVPQGTPAKIQVRNEEHGNRVRVWIEDNGIGVSTQDQERIFQMFVQVNDGRVYGGTGVGLAIVKKAVQTMRGTVGVESTDGTGSRFWFELEKAG